MPLSLCVSLLGLRIPPTCMAGKPEWFSSSGVVVATLLSMLVLVFFIIHGGATTMYDYRQPAAAIKEKGMCLLSIYHGFLPPASIGSPCPWTSFIETSGGTGGAPFGRTRETPARFFSTNYPDEKEVSALSLPFPIDG
ncbi:hypothetical protein M406DRAFT_333261 [Cryphonectria parasitica EP155]|uniref:Uncharacterized protein n=1 Tax=Cryphonectria parasitica (strain ATCC 38755 / EP155) TaxID=660469 RepID=A0A9P4XXU6_CRYP1|nr:uncharacterized protein M406DRAFT_333261 [Cryphonectria parasitica EP155]KAF3762914.1 hypothetical protein M406DRAFT_333261 [Cryphonectria parasitica EP155]